MGTDSLSNRTNGQVIDQDFLNLFNRVLQGDFVGRDSSGAATSGQNLGTPTIPWGTIRAATLILGGSSVDPSLIAAPPNRVISSAKKTTSDFPDFIRPAGVAGGANFDVLGSAVDLVLDVNGAEATIDTDINKASLTVAPASNNTCLVNDTGLTGQDSTKNLGEDGTTITVDNMGSSISAKIGEFVALKNQTSGEILYCLVESAGILSHAKRGFFLDDAGAPIYRAVLNNNEVLQLMSLAFIFADVNTTTIDVTYRNPAISGAQPGSPQTGDYWLDTSVLEWKRYDGATYISIDRTFIGYAVLDTTDCIGARSEYIGKTYSDENTLKVGLEDVDTIISDQENFLISIDGSLKKFNFNFAGWFAASSFESGVSRTASRSYWLYITEDGKTKISDKKPYDTRGILSGLYHPFESWRSVAEIYNNGSNEFSIIKVDDKIIDNIVALDISGKSISGDMIATEAEADAGAAADKIMTPLAVRQATPRRTESHWHTVNVYGSTNTKIQKFTTELIASNDIVVTVVNSAADGFSIAANMDCKVDVSFVPHFNAAGSLGLSKNSTALTTAIESIPASERVTHAVQSVINQSVCASWAGILANGDVIRPHTSGTANGGFPSRGLITLVATEILS